MGNRPILVDRELVVDFDDAKIMEVGKKYIFLKLGLVIVKSIENNNDNYKIVAEYLPEDKDFKKKDSVDWLAKN